MIEPCYLYNTFDSAEKYHTSQQCYILYYRQIDMSANISLLQIYGINVDADGLFSFRLCAVYIGDTFLV